MTLFDPAPTTEALAWARLSDCGTYRYTLGRRWADGPVLRWVMLNPSTADAAADDPTIRRVVRFSRDAGYGAAVVVNLYALRSTDPRALAGHADPVGPDGDAALRGAADAARQAGTPMVCAWGARAGAGRAADVLAGPLAGAELRCLGHTLQGHPRHPLYVPVRQRLVAFRAGGGELT